jgi:hypothetical protein
LLCYIILGGTEIGVMVCVHNLDKQLHDMIMKTLKTDMEVICGKLSVGKLCDYKSRSDTRCRLS